MKPLKAAIVGAGRRSPCFAGFCAEHRDIAEVAYVVDIDIDRAQLLNDFYKLNASVIRF